MATIHLEPLQFLKAHSKDKGDLSTQIWDCFFSKYGTELVTCGGNSVCFILTKSFESEKLSVKKYCAKDPREIFLSLTETYIEDEWIVIAAGAKQEVHLIDAKRNICIKIETLSQTKTTCKRNAINSILVHPDNPSVILCSTNSGEIIIVDIGKPTYPNYVCDFTYLKNLTLDCGEIFSVIYEPISSLFLCATNKGLIGFNKDYEVITFQLPLSNRHDNEGQLVDSVQNVFNGNIAVKCALHGNIYVCDMKSIKKDKIRKIAQSTNNNIKLEAKTTLKWSDTDNYFMGVGYNEYSNLLYCGDDEGSIWMYSLPSSLDKTDMKKQIDPVHILTWPEVVDLHAIYSKKINLDVYDIVINKVIMHPQALYLIAITSNNYVCIWRNELSVLCN